MADPYADLTARTAENFVSGLVLFIFMAACYFLPGIVASGRRHHNAGAIWLLTTLLGWTVVCWLAALIWAATAPNPALRNQSAARTPSTPPTHYCTACGTIRTPGTFCGTCGARWPVG